MVGQSYLGLVQYFAAPERPPHLRAMSPVSGPVSYYENCTYRRGVFELGWMLAYFTFMQRDTLERKGVYEQYKPLLDARVAYPDMPMSPLKKEEYRHLPLSDWAKRFKDGAPYFARFSPPSNRRPVLAGAPTCAASSHNINVPMLPRGLVVRRVSV